MGAWLQRERRRYGWGVRDPHVWDPPCEQGAVQAVLYYGSLSVTLGLQVLPFFFLFFFLCNFPLWGKPAPLPPPPPSCAVGKWGSIGGTPGMEQCSRAPWQCGGSALWSHPLLHGGMCRDGPRTPGWQLRAQVPSQINTSDRAPCPAPGWDGAAGRRTAVGRWALHLQL